MTAVRDGIARDGTARDGVVRDAIRALVDALDAAVASHATRAVDYRIGGGTWRVHCTAASGADAMLAACAALREPSNPADTNPGAGVGADPGPDPDLEVFVWNDAVDRVALPDSAVLRRDRVPDEGLGGFSDAARHAFFQPQAGALSVIDFERRRAHWWLRDAAATPYFERAAPLKHILQWWMAAQGGALLHGAAVCRGTGTAARGVLIAGPSGSGKSTTGLACLAAGLGFTADDYVLVDGATPPRAHLAYSTAKFLRADLARQRQWVAHVRNLDRNDEKPMLFVDQVLPQSVRESFVVEALVLPRVAHAERTRFTPLGGAAMLRALAPSSMLLFPLAGARSLRRMAELCSSLPCFRADLADDAREVGRAFADFLAHPAATGARAVA